MHSFRFLQMKHITKYLSWPAILPSTPTMPPEEPGACPGQEWVHYGDSCFLFRPNTYKGWGEADYECAKDGSILATMRDSAENWFVWKKLAEATIGPTLRGSWFGLSRKTVGKYASCKLWVIYQVQFPTHCLKVGMLLVRPTQYLTNHEVRY